MRQVKLLGVSLLEPVLRFLPTRPECDGHAEWDRLRRPASHPRSYVPDQTLAENCTLSKRERVKATVTNANGLGDAGIRHLLKWTRKGWAQGPPESTGWVQWAAATLAQSPDARQECGLVLPTPPTSREAQDPDFYVKSLNF